MSASERFQSPGQLIARVLIGLQFVVAGIFETHAQYFNDVSRVVKNPGVAAGLLCIALYGGGSISMDAMLARSRGR